MEWFLQREPSARATTLGAITDELGVQQCLTLEDQVREPTGWNQGITEWDADGLAKAVAKWKVKNETAIPSGRYRLTLEPSNRFGPDTITINGVPGFSKIRMHGGTTIEDTEGCVLVGDRENRDNMTIAGAKFDHVLARLKLLVRAALARGEGAWITIKNPEEENGAQTA